MNSNIKDIIINEFNNVINELNIIDDLHPKRVFKEVKYFEIYLEFISNSTYFGKFKYETYLINNKGRKKKHIITGKYLNEKYNYWNNNKVFHLMYMNIRKEYVGLVNKTYPEIFKNISTDTLFIPNKFAPKKKVGGRNKYYKSKYGQKMSTFNDRLNAPISISIDNGNKNDAKIGIKQVNEVAVLINSEQYKNSKKYSRNCLCDPGYDSNEFKEELKKNNIRPIIDYNKRNTKDPEKLKEKTLTRNENVNYKKRKFIEHSYSHYYQRSPRQYRVHDTKLNNFDGINKLLGAIKIIEKINIIKSGCVKDHIK